MKINKIKVVYILMGLIVGFAMGASLILWKHTILRDISITGKIRNMVSSFFVSKNESDSLLNIYESSKDKSLNKVINKGGNKIQDDIKIDTLDYYEEGYDTLMYDTLFFLESNYEFDDIVSTQKSDTEIVVMRDKLLLTKQIDALSDAVDNENSLDSLLIGGKQVKSNYLNYTVEFWESPLNYRGYKRSKNKIVLYGVRDTEKVILKRLNKNLYIKYLNEYYLIEDTPHFQNLIPVNSPHTLNQLNQL